MRRGTPGENGFLFCPGPRRPKHLFQGPPTKIEPPMERLLFSPGVPPLVSLLLGPGKSLFWEVFSGLLGPSQPFLSSGLFCASGPFPNLFWAGPLLSEPLPNLFWASGLGLFLGLFKASDLFPTSSGPRASSGPFLGFCFF